MRIRQWSAFIRVPGPSGMGFITVECRGLLGRRVYADLGFRVEGLGC